MKPLTPTDHEPAGDDLDLYVEAFESDAHAVGPDALAAYLPAADHPAFAEIVTEMVRVDLERRTLRGEPARLRDYQAVVPAMFATPSVLAPAAFEEYRLRKRSGEQLRPEQVAAEYSIDAAHWPSGSVPDAATSRPEEPQVGDQFAGFELVELLGRGAFGAVFVSRQHELSSREVVLKITPKRSVEAQRLAKLHHTNITPIYSMHTHEGWLGICMPYLGRQTLAAFTGAGARGDLASTLAKRLDETIKAPKPGAKPRSLRRAEKAERRSQPTAERAALEIVRQLADGLAHAHARGIVHSDIKPANILLGDDGVARLLDFNLASDSTAADTQTLVVGGTLPYLAPEHLDALSRGQAVRPASDVYSLGVLLYQLVTGKAPFPPGTLGPGAKAPEPAALNLETLAEERRRFSLESPAADALSPTVRALLRKSLAADPADRYQAAELADDLARHLDDLPLRHTGEPASRQRLAKWGRRNRTTLRWAGMLALAAGIAAVSGIALNRSHRLERVEAQREFDAFDNDALAARLMLHTPGSEPEIWSRGSAAAELALARFAPPHATRLGLLTAEQAAAVARETQNLSHLLAELDRRQHGDSGAVAPLGLQPSLGSSDPIAAAAALMTSRDYAGAIRLLTEVDAAYASDPVRWLLLGNALAATGRLNDADSAYTALIALQPDAMAGYYNRGLARVQAGRQSLAVDDFSAALSRSPQTACVLLNRAVASRGIGQFESAEQDATRALEIDNSDCRAWLLRADLRRSLGNAQGTKSDVERGLTLEPRDDLGWSARGMALATTDPEQAAEQLQRGAALFPNSVSLHKNLIFVLADRLDRPADAMRHAQRLAQLRPHDPTAKLSLAVLHARAGDRAAALAALPELAPEQATPIDALQQACVYSLTSASVDSDAAKAVDWLQAAFAKEPRLGLRAAKDPDLAALRRLPAYRELIGASLRLSMPKPSAPAAETAAGPPGPKQL
ncbi:Serine/threonine-protein kinase PknB [Posidoniimonas polymericola]|uniref:non-specific serine/threonine protein kinase n=1 Tax=Posidoniimonas polymericola TaxID=2528002 RepID=A0A5C5XSM6_9BACT|nr:serine/threonine-protein kinase [Posidoniimonas polymericola]TWT66256.1 Serine/threonine-protein kinase PknB [Posidoniimonas polymericola]